MVYEFAKLQLQTEGKVKKTFNFKISPTLLPYILPLDDLNGTIKGIKEIQ